MQVTINGESRVLENTMTVQNLIENLALDARKIAVERNLAIVPKSLYADTTIADGDRLEIVQFMGGG